MTKKESARGAAAQAAGDLDRRDSFDGILLIYGVVAGPLAALVGAAIATAVSDATVVTALFAVTSVVIAGILADPVLTRVRNGSDD